MTNHNKTYFPDIDGLRAVAVLAVVFFHAKVPGFSGGFVGVDVFFVISGFLISGLLLKELKTNGKISLVHFYERRARRILPAFFAMTTFSLVVGAIILPPTMFESLAKSAISAQLFIANMWFLHTVGYFNAGTQHILLHTWSLSVEEQFYIFFPILLIILSRLKLMKWLGYILIISLITTLIMSQIIVAHKPSYAFYLSPLRAWELLAGVLLHVQWSSRKFPIWFFQYASWAGFFLILASIIYLTPLNVFPGISAVPVILGTTLIILGTKSTERPIVNQLLASPLPVFFGKISYSLYLWHFPLLAFVEFIFEGHAPKLIISLTLLASFFMSWISWKWIEQPFRSPNGFNRKKIFALSAFGLSSLIVISSAILLSHGIPSRFSPKLQKIIMAAKDYNADRYLCFAKSHTIETLNTPCIIGDLDTPKTFLVWGDSHGESMRVSFEILAHNHQKTGSFIGIQGCPPLQNVTHSNNNKCSLLSEKILNFINKNTSIKTIFLVARWP